jgi:hypothetical protein
MSGDLVRATRGKVGQGFDTRVVGSDLGSLVVRGRAPIEDVTHVLRGSSERKGDLMGAKEMRPPGGWYLG